MSIGTLHDLGCEGPSDCTCAVVYIVREGYTSMVGVSDESDTTKRGPVVLAYSKDDGVRATPGVRR